MARTLTTKGGAPGTAGAGGSLLVLLFPSDAVPMECTGSHQWSRNATGAALCVKPALYFSRIVKNGFPAPWPTTHRRSEGTRQETPELCLKLS